MTRQEFVEKWRHELAGMCLDAALAGRHEASLGLWARAMMQKLDKMLAQMYDEVSPEKAIPAQKTANVAANGPHRSTSQTRG